MKFRTEYLPERDRGLTLRPERPLVLVGSCFADNISARMRSCLWDAENPLGVLFNPLSIADALELCLLDPDPMPAFEGSLFESGGVWHSWMFDTGMSALTREECRAMFRERRRVLREAVERGGCLFVTFGTSWCYFLKDRPGTVAANCHKMPGGLFERRRVSTEEIATRWRGLFDRLRLAFPGLRIVLTVSPVRHVRDGLHGNAVSKAVLLLAVEELCATCGGASYFPAYEIVNDDLRDYRFYASDLVHPSAEAVEYIWEAFTAAYLDDAGRRYLKEGESLRRRLEHRPLMPGAPGAAEFKEETRRMLAGFLRRYPGAAVPREFMPEDGSECCPADDIACGV